jgi:hypothetical protein
LTYNYILGQGDTQDIDETIYIKNAVADLTNATVIFCMRNLEDVEYNIICKVKSPATAGVVTIPFTSVETEISGLFYGEFIIIIAGKQITYSPLDYFTIFIKDALFDSLPVALPTPTFSVTAGTYSLPQTIELSSTIEGARIYYTLDGSTPTESSTRYTAPISVITTHTLKAIAVKAGYYNSAVGSATYTIVPDTVPTPSISPVTGYFYPTQTVTITCSDSQAVIHYTTDNTTPTSSSLTYSSAFSVSATTTVRAIATRQYFNDSSEATARTYTLITETVPTPSISPVSGRFYPTQTVTLTCSDTQATIHYTTDGNLPTASSTTYTAPFSVSTTTTVRAIAVRTGYFNSSEATARTYNYSTEKSPTPSISPVTGYFAPTQTVTITCADPTAVIHYTTDNTTPTASSTTYTAPFTVSSTTTVRAISTRTNYVDSDEATARTYTLITETVPTPSISPVTGYFSPTQTVTLSCSDSEAVIHYTTDNTAPTVSSTTYTTPFTVSSTTTVRAIAVRSGYFNSSEATARTYTLITETCATPVISPTSQTFTTTLEVSISCSTEGANIRYTTDNSEPTSTSDLYTSPFTVSSNSVVRAKAFKTGYFDSSEATARTYSLICATPVISPTSGTYTGRQHVSISCATSGATIHYTTDGTTPTEESTTYTGTFHADDSMIVKAIAVRSGYLNSSESASYLTIEHTLALVQATGVASRYETTPIVSPSITVTEGNTILVFLSAYLESEQFAVSDNLSNTYHAIGSMQEINGIIGQWFYAKVENAGSCVVTGVIDHGFNAMRVIEVSGLLDSPVDVSYPPNYTIAMAQANEIIFAGYHYENSYTLEHGYATLTGAGSEVGYGSVIRPVIYKITSVQTTESPYLIMANNAHYDIGFGVGLKGRSTINLVKNPVISPSSTFFTTSQQIEMTCESSDAEIYYTTDGNTPTAESTRYIPNQPFTITDTVTIKAIAILGGIFSSDVITCDYANLDTYSSIDFTHTGQTFKPIISVTGTPLIQWTYADGTTANTATPESKDFGTATERITSLRVMPWSSVVGINLGYADAYDGAYDYSNPNGAYYIGLQTVANTQQNVKAVSGLSVVKDSLRVFTISQNPILSLDFTDFSELEVIECYYSDLSTIRLSGTTALKRLCVEACDLTHLDLSDCVLLEDIRSAGQTTLGCPYRINWGNIGAHMWHMCTQGTYDLASTPDWSNFTALKELWVWNTNYSGALTNAPSTLTSLQADNCEFTSADISLCTNVSTVSFNNNLLSSYAVDTILACVDGFGTSNGVLNLVGNKAPTSSTHINSLVSRNWTVTNETVVANKVYAPDFSTQSCYFSSPITLSLTGHTADATIYYTDDGTTPDNTKTQYLEPIGISTTKTIKAISIKSGMTDSDIVTATYRYSPPLVPEIVNHTLAQLYDTTDEIYVTNGNLILVNVISYNNSQTITISDTLGNTYQEAATQSTISSITGNWFWTYSNSSGYNKVTAHHNGSHQTIRVIELSGISATNPVDVTLYSQGTTSGQFTTTNAHDLIFAVWHTDGTPSAFVPDTDYTIGFADGINRFSICRPVEYKQVTTVQTNATVTLGHTGGSVFASWLVAIKTA